jgi:uncharacterized protein
MIASGLPGANRAIINLFALLHDSQRLSDGSDANHGERAAEFAASLRAEGLFELSDEHFQLLYYACAHHTDSLTSSDATIGACWDADRLDLGRVGVKPEARYMSTSAGCKAAAADRRTFLSVDTQGGLESGVSLIDSPTRAPATGLFARGLSAAHAAKLMRNYKDPRQFEIETALEVVRRQSFPWFPCRQSVLFACENWEQLRLVAKYIRRPERLEGCSVYEITGQSYGPFDGDLPYLAINTTDPFDRAKLYWSGGRTNAPVLEYLIEAPITIGRQVGVL